MDPGRATDDGKHSIAIKTRLVKQLQYDHPTAFATHVTVRRSVKSAAAATWRKHPRFAQINAWFWRKQNVHTAC